MTVIGEDDCCRPEWGDGAMARGSHWRYDWPTGHVRGTDLLRVRDGLIAEKLAYVKG